MGEAQNSPLAGVPVTMRAVVTFFLPIALSVFVVSFIYPIFSWGISRFAQSKDALSAFSIARSLFYIMASPILVLRQTVVALVSDVASYRAIRKFALIVIIGNFLLFLLPGLPWLSPLVFGTIMGVEGSLFTMSRSVYLLFSVAILLNGYSLFLQGLAILGKRTRHIFYSMLIQIVSLAILLGFSTALPMQNGAVAATASYLGGLLLTALYLEVMVHRQAVAVLARAPAALLPVAARSVFSVGGTLKFFLPLVLATFILCLGVPMINATLAKTSRSTLFLSAFDIAWGLGWLIVGMTEVAHQVPLYFLKQHPDSKKQVLRFLAYFGLLCTALIALIGFTPLGLFIIESLMGIEPELSPFVLLSMQALTALPLLIVLRQYIWGVLMHEKATSPVTWGKAVNIICLFLVLRGMNLFGSTSPAVYVMLAMAVAEGVELGYLLIHRRLGLRKSLPHRETA